MNKLFLPAFILLFSFAAISAESARDLLDRDLQIAIKKLTNETRFYTYFSTKTIKSEFFNSEINRANLAVNQVSGLSNQFWNLSNHRTALANAGLGLYLASDPFISSPAAQYYTDANFGETMIELTFPQETNYFSVQKVIELKADTIEALIAENILSAKQIKNLLTENMFTQDTLKLMAGSEYLLFRQMVQTFMIKNSISLIEYSWLTSLELFCFNKTRTSAFVYIGDIDSKSPKQTLIYWPGNIKKMGLSLEELEPYQRNRKLIKLLSKIKPLEKNSKIAKAQRYIKELYSDETELEEVRSHLFKCE